MSDRAGSILVAALIGLSLALPLAACGKRAPPVAPKDQPNVYPRTYPNDPNAPVKPSAPDAFPAPDSVDGTVDPTQTRTKD